jgi:hypothetical protein
MADPIQILRYVAYFKGWCQAFGEHESIQHDAPGVTFLSADEQLGIILPSDIFKTLAREVLGKMRTPPELVLREDAVRIGNLDYRAESTVLLDNFATLNRFIRASTSLHLFLTYHFMYPAGTRIITLSRQKPQLLIYKEITPVLLSLE